MPTSRKLTDAEATFERKRCAWFLKRSWRLEDDIPDIIDMIDMMDDGEAFHKHAEAWLARAELDRTDEDVRAVAEKSALMALDPWVQNAINHNLNKDASPREIAAECARRAIDELGEGGGASTPDSRESGGVPPSSSCPTCGSEGTRVRYHWPESRSDA